jgi:hypothetical protein
MNERIKELAVQARNHALDEKRIYERMHNTEQCMEEYREVYNKRFAELIVEECCNRLSKETILHDGYGYNQHELYNRLRKHFGVK